MVLGVTRVKVGTEPGQHCDALGWLHTCKLRRLGNYVRANKLDDALHGKDVDAIRPMLEAFAERHSGAVERIPPYKPIVFKAQRPVMVVATVQAPISVAADARSFAEFLDGEGQDDVPMLLPLSELYQMAPLADSVEPLPWD